MRVEDDLYECAGERYLCVLARAGDAQTVVVVVGHEPTTSHVAAWLSGEGSLERRSRRCRSACRPSAAAILEFDGPWAEIGHRAARLVDVVDGQARLEAMYE